MTTPLDASTFDWESKLNGVKQFSFYSDTHNNPNIICGFEVVLAFNPPKYSVVIE